MQRAAISTPGCTILAVAQDPQLVRALAAWLADSGCEYVLASSYAAAKRQLAAGPDVVITEVKLAEYNGLHLALRGQAAGIPTIVLGPEDQGFEREAEQVGALYIAADELNWAELGFLIEQSVVARGGAMPAAGGEETGAGQLLLH